MIITALDRKLLSTPFRLQTNWIVLTGASCSGKTTLINLLADKGYPIIPESARPMFEAEIAKGRTIEEIRQEGDVMQRAIATMQFEIEQHFETTTMAFLDRALPDSLTFHRIFDIDPNEILPMCFFRRYAAVFVLDRLPFLRDQALGPEDKVSSDFQDDWLVRDYQALNYDVIRVPVLSPDERVAYVLDRLSEPRGI